MNKYIIYEVFIDEDKNTNTREVGIYDSKSTAYEVARKELVDIFNKDKSAGFDVKYDFTNLCINFKNNPNYKHYLRIKSI